MPDGLNIYGPLFLVGILLSAWLWGRMTRRSKGEHDARLTIVYFAGLFGALIGAKVAFLLAEGWFYRDDWMAMLSGRSVTGALLGGYIAVEMAKRWLRYQSVTGDFFAVIVPIALALGRIGCLVQGCCAGVACSRDHWWAWHDAAGAPHWPAQAVELLFNAFFLAWAILAARFDWVQGNRFHIYLIAYALFRFGHEFLRDRIEIVGDLGGYHFIAIGLAVFGAIRFIQRRTSDPHSRRTPVTIPHTTADSSILSG